LSVNAEQLKSLLDLLFKTEYKTAAAAKAVGYNFRLAPSRVQSRITQLRTRDILAVTEGLAQLTDVFELCAQEEVNPWDDLTFLRLSMRHLGLHFADDFTNLIGDEDLIEGYDMHRRQIFRNLRFMETSNYSLLEILSHDWPMLFHREQYVTDALTQQAERDLWSQNKTIRSDAPRHIMREILCEPATAFEVEHKYFVPLYSGPGRPAGVLSVCEGKPLNIEVSIDRGRLSYLS
jgi:hypothetical protein